jgi:periplasmic protein TonB
MTSAFINKKIKQFRLMDLFNKCLTFSFMLHVIIASAYFISTMPSFSSGNDEFIDASNVSFKDTEVDFIDIPQSVLMGGDTNPAPVEKQEWVEGSGKDKPDASNTDVNINKLSGDGTDEDGYMFADLADRPPIAILDFDINDYYPKAARSANIFRKTIVVKLQINENGSIQSVKITSPPAGYGFEEAAMKIVQRLKFRPGKIKGKPVKMVAEQPLMFEAED